MCVIVKLLAMSSARSVHEEQTWAKRAEMQELRALVPQLLVLRWLTEITPEFRNGLTRGKGHTTAGSQPPLQHTEHPWSMPAAALCQRATLTFKISPDYTLLRPLGVPTMREMPSAVERCCLV